MFTYVAWVTYAQKRVVKGIKPKESRDSFAYQAVFGRGLWGHLGFAFCTWAL